MQCITKTGMVNVSLTNHNVVLPQQMESRKERKKLKNVAIK